MKPDEHVNRMFEQEPEPLDEEDPEVEEELCASLYHMGARPEDLPDPEERERYAAWLALHPDGLSDEEEEDPEGA